MRNSELCCLSKYKKLYHNIIYGILCEQKCLLQGILKLIFKILNFHMNFFCISVLVCGANKNVGGVIMTLTKTQFITVLKYEFFAPYCSCLNYL